MYSYHLIQWLLFLYIYCFLGWMWESAYVSFCNKRWVNRGFLHGPFVPIYGFGAITVLLTTIPVKDNLALVFLFGMTGATILEYCTGVVMEKLFHVRYWDYSNKKLNVNGHICLTSSLAWGAFSMIMIRMIHTPIEMFVLWIPYEAAEAAAFLLTILLAVDFTQSFNEAMDLKELLENLTESKEEIKRIKKRVEAVMAIVASDRKEFLQKAADSKQALEDRIADIKVRYEKIREEQKEKLDQKRLTRATNLRLNLSKSREDQSIKLAILSERLTLYLDTIKANVSKENRAEEFEKLRMELEDFKTSILKQTNKLHNRSDKSYHRSLRLLRRNPDAVSKEYPEALKEVQSLDREEE